MYSINDIYKVWYDIFFSPQYAIVLGLCRILMACLCMYKACTLWKHADDYFGPNGLYPYDVWKNSHSGKFYFSIFHCVDSSIKSVYVILCGLLISSFFLLLGYYTEISAIFTYIFWISIVHRNMYVFNSGDSLLRIVLFLMIFAGCGYSLSLDNYILGRDQFYETINPWVWRLIQFCLINLYLQSVYAKINYGQDWREGFGLYYALSTRAFNRSRVSDYMNKSFWRYANHGTLLIETIFPLGLCFKESNAISLIVLFGFHLVSEIIMRIGLFGVVMMVCLCFFIDPVWLADFMSYWTSYIISGQ